jgi:general secretion pathway protein K
MNIHNHQQEFPSCPTTAKQKLLLARVRLHRQKQKRRGVALIMVLAAVTILTVLLTEFQDESSAEMASAIADRDALKAEYAARSAVNLSRLLIATEPTIRTAIGPLLSLMMGGNGAPQIPIWEFADSVLGAFNGDDGTKSFNSLAGVSTEDGRNLGMKGASFQVAIIDEDSKINVNLAARGDAITQQRLGMQMIGLLRGDQYNPLFEKRDSRGDVNDRPTVCGEIVDWADPDEIKYPCDPFNSQNTGTSGEEGYYQLLARPYRRKNAPFDSLEELHLIRGVTDDFYATFIDPDPNEPKKRIMTIWGQGTVNVNSANAQTLLGLVCGFAVPETPLCNDPLLMGQFLTMVNLLRGFTAGAPLFTSPNGFVNAMQGRGMFGKILQEMVGLPPVQFISAAELAKAVSTESKMFSIYADGIVPGYQRTTKVRIHAVVDFRTAPPPGLGTGAAGALGGLGGTQGGLNGTNPLNGGLGAGALGGRAGGTNPPGGANGATTINGVNLGDDAILAAITPSAGGSIVYYRIE